MKFPIRLALVVALAGCLVIGTLAIPRFRAPSGVAPAARIIPAPRVTQLPVTAPASSSDTRPAASSSSKAPAVVPDLEVARRTPGLWTLDLSGRSIPEANATGQLYGKPFEVVDAEIRNNILTLADGDTFEWRGRFFVFLFLRDGNESLAGRTISLGTKVDWDAPVAAHVHLHGRTDHESGFETSAKTDGFALELRFGQPQGDKLPGSIYLCYPDEARSYVAGSFIATLE